MSTHQTVMQRRRIESILAVVLFLVAAILAIVFLFITNVLNPLLVGVSYIVLFLLLIGLFITQKRTDAVLSGALAISSQAEDARFRSLYDNSPVPYITIDAEGAIVMANPAAVSFLRSHQDRFGQRDFYSYVAEYAEHGVGVLRSKIKTGITVNDTEVRLTPEDGEDVWALMSVFEDKDNHQFIVSLVDITQAKKVDAAKSEFVALATHQLRTPIAAIRWNNELLETKMQGPEFEQHQSYLQKIERNTIRMIGLINDFLSASQLEMGTYAAKEEEMNMGTYFSEILDEYTEKIASKHIQVVSSIVPDEISITADTRLFHIVIHNLVSNAIKYMPQNGTLTLTAEQTAAQLVITVADTGIGIPAHEQEQLFKRFFRATNARSHQVEGTGLGLYLVQQAVQQLGGAIDVTSVENEGTTFTVTLPHGHGGQ